MEEDEPTMLKIFFLQLQITHLCVLVIRNKCAITFFIQENNNEWICESLLYNGMIKNLKIINETLVMMIMNFLILKLLKFS